jgi:hypothetical protein
VDLAVIGGVHGAVELAGDLAVGRARRRTRPEPGGMGRGGRGLAGASRTMGSGVRGRLVEASGGKPVRMGGVAIVVHEVVLRGSSFHRVR